MQRHFAPISFSLILLLSLVTFVPNADAQSTPDIRISEILVSASGEDYNGTDWNGDGVIGSISDQFIEIWNAGNEPVDVSNWWLDDDENGGSAACQLAWNTTIPADGRIVVFRADSDIELDYWNGDSVSLRDESMNLIDQLSYPGEDSWWDNSYVPQPNGSLAKVRPPTPGGQPGETVGAGVVGVGCYKVRDHIHDGSYVLGGRLVTMESENSVIENGYLLVEDGQITQIWENSIPENVSLQNVPIVDTNATIYPGLIDLHNHLHYNMVPLWDMNTHLSNPNEWGGYNNRYEWKNHPDYSTTVTKPKMLIQSGPYWNMEIESMKYVELKSIAGGTTAAQGSPSNPDDAYASILARNIEDWNFGRDEIHTKVTELEPDYIGNHIKTGNASGELDAWFLHLGEGVDESSRAEFDILVANDLLVGELVLIHGTALGQAEFEQMAAVGASLAWSPLSNLLLYGTTTDVATAKEAGVSITLSPDWAPSGSKSPLHELKVADLWDDEMLGDIFSDYELVEMVTSGAARATNWEEHVGTLRVGNAADIVVIDTIHENPYTNLIHAVDPDVRLSVVGGLAVYGDLDVMTALKGEDFEPAGMFGKQVDVTFRGIESGSQTWQSISDNLSMAMNFDSSQMQEAFGDANNYDSLVAGISQEGLDPWWTYGDQRYFRVINESSNANARIDMSLLYDRYYDRNETISEISADLEVSNRVTEVQDNHPRITSTSQGYRLSECDATPSQINGLPDVSTLNNNQYLLCGAVEVLVDEYDGCFEEVWEDGSGNQLDDSWLVWRSSCENRTAWTQAHRGISEIPLPADDSDLVSRLSPVHQVGDAIAFPGVMCDSISIQQIQLPNANAEPFTKANRLSNWECSDVFRIITVQEEQETETSNNNTNQNGTNFVVCTDDSVLPECNTESQEEIAAGEDRTVLFALTGALMFVFAIVVGFIVLSSSKNELAEHDSKVFEEFVPKPPSMSPDSFSTRIEEE